MLNIKENQQKAVKYGIEDNSPDEIAIQKSYLKMMFSNPILAGSYIKVGVHSEVHYVNQFFLIQEDFELTLAEIEQFLFKHKTADIFIAPETYRNSESATKENVNYITALKADYDNYNGINMKSMDESEAITSRTAIQEALVSGKVKPSLIICSGNGLHGYWLLDKPLPTAGNEKKIECLQKTLTNQYQGFTGDTAAAVLGHTLRLPGTKNHKDPDDVKDCTIVWTDDMLAYAFDDLVQELNVTTTNFEEPTVAKDSMYQTFQSLGVDDETFINVANECHFVQNMSTNPDLQNYMNWVYLGLNYAVFGETGRKAFHKSSKIHPNYRHDETERMYSSFEEKVKNSGYKPASCATICEAGFKCPKTCQQKSPAGMTLSTLIKADKQQKMSVEVDLEAELKRIVPKLSNIDNMRLINAFILEKINPSSESQTIKIAFLKEAMKILGIPERGNLKTLTSMIKVVSVKGGTGNFEVDMGEEILKAKGFIFVAGRLMIYDDGIWRKYKGTLEWDIINQLKGNYDKRVVESIAFYIKNKSFKPMDDMNTHRTENIICLSNGMLQMKADGTIQLLEHRKDYFALNRLDIVFDPLASCSKFLGFLNECFSALSERDRKVTIEALQEWFGYTLVTGNEFDRFALLIGKTRSGKSVVQEVLTDLLGSSNVSNISISILHQPINTISLFEKLINIGPEFGSSTRFNEEFFKSLTSGDGISGRGHSKDPFSFQNGAKMMFASNEFPTILDSSGALYERALCFPFNNTVPEHKRNIHLSDELKKERSGILLWALQGRARLLKRGRFIESTPMLALKDKVKLRNDSVLSWFESEKATFDRTVTEYTVVSWWNQYKNYCIEENQKQNKRSEFIEILEAVPGISKIKPSTSNQYCFLCNWSLIDTVNSEPNTETTEVIEVSNQIIPQLELCPTVAVEPDQDVLSTVDETNITTLVRTTIQQMDDDLSAFN